MFHANQDATAISPLPGLQVGRSSQIRQDPLDRGFSLAYFIFPDRTAALEILTVALEKLESRTGQERKRAYWRDKFLRRRITRITRQDQDTLQWLIFLESDSHEEAQEALGHSSDEDMVVRFIKTLIRLSAGLSSFYVNIAVHRLLYCYTTAEAQSIYEFVTDHYCEADGYRRAKRLLMTRLESRFGERLRTVHSDRGETRYDLADSQEPWRDLVMNSLQMFTPWSTEAQCLSLRQSLAHRARDGVRANCDDSGNQDKIEITRCHVFMDPLCAGSVVQELGLEPHSSKLGVPRFYSMDADQSKHPPSHRFPDVPLTSQERQAISNTLSAEEKRRRKVVARELRFVVDGIECGCLDLHRPRQVSFNAPAGCQLIETWTNDKHGPLLLATYVMPRAETHSDAKAGFTLLLKGRARINVSAVMEDELRCWNISAVVANDDRLTAVSSVLRRLAHAPALPAYVGMLVLCFAIIFLGLGFHRKLASERSIEKALRTELAQRQTVHTTSDLSQQIPHLPVYRLTPDDLVARSASEAQEHAIRVPSVPTVISLELPVPNAKHQYKAALSFLNNGKTILTQESLVPVSKLGETTVKVSLPSNVLVPSRFYRVQVQDPTSGYVRAFTFYTAPGQP